MRDDPQHTEAPIPNVRAGIEEKPAMSPVVLAFAKHVMPQLVWVLSVFIPGRDSAVARKNAQNNAYIMELVARVTSILPPRGTYVPLVELVEKCYAMGSFPALWAVEGLGHYYGDTFYDRGEPLSNLLTDPKVTGLPSKSLTMLHAGIGLAFADHGLKHLTPESPAAQIRKALTEFLDHCRNSSREGYAGAAIESLGLVTRFFHGLKMAFAVDRHLSELSPQSVGYFWHGAGRAIYFLPPNLLPGLGTPWRAVIACHREPPHELARQNMLAGLAWATTLVNMRQPKIMASMLKYHGKEFVDDDAFSNGVVSATIMRYDTSPDDPYIAPFLTYRPSDPGLANVWDDLISTPCRDGIDRLHGVLKEHRSLEAVFQYQSLTGVVDKLENKRPSASSALQSKDASHASAQT
ncbi:MAG TPA: hypothetical protein VGL91_24130 [Acidobacteriota bacterium]|jgi:hypothetical protein